jgi:hypothetical protein
VHKNRIDLTGQRFGSWKVLTTGDNHNYSGSWLHPQNMTSWVCECDCGNVREVLTVSLRKGTSKSCGCRRRMTRQMRAYLEPKEH